MIAIPLNNLVRKHWGGLSNPVLSFLLIGFCVFAVWFLLERLIEFAIRLQAGMDESLTVILGLLLLCAFGLPATIWWWVGSWRAASKRQSTRVLKILSFGIKFTIVVLALMYAAILWRAILPELTSAILDLAGDPSQGPRGVTVQDGRLRIYGFLDWSVAREFDREVNTHKRIRIVEFASRGGRIGPALKIGDIIKENKFDTVVKESCYSACIFPFLSGEQRVVIAPTAKLGFHSATFLQSGLVIGGNRLPISILSNLGVPGWFVKRAFSSRSVWYPSYNELLSAHVVTSVVTTVPHH